MDTETIIVEKADRPFAIGRGYGMELVTFTAIDLRRPTVSGYGKTKEEAKRELTSGAWYDQTRD